MGAENTKTFEVPQSAPIQELDIEDNQTESAPYTGPRLRDSRDMAAFGVGTAAGFLADSMQRHGIQEKINDQNKTQADAAYMAQMRMELQRMQDAEYRRQIDARNEFDTHQSFGLLISDAKIVITHHRTHPYFENSGRGCESLVLRHHMTRGKIFYRNVKFSCITQNFVIGTHCLLCTFTPRK
jgi:hypothetical protein